MNSDKAIDKRLKPFLKKAKRYMQDKDQSRGLLNKAVRKADSRGVLSDKPWGDFRLLFEVFRDWINGSYTEMPSRSLLMIVLGIVYFAAPIDGILDYIPFIGLLDDAAVAGFVISQIRIDLERYKHWRQMQNQRFKTAEVNDR